MLNAVPVATEIENELSSTSIERSLNFASPIFRSSTYSRTAGTAWPVRSVGSDIDTNTEKKSHRTRAILKDVLSIEVCRILSKEVCRILSKGAR